MAWKGWENWKPPGKGIRQQPKHKPQPATPSKGEAMLALHIRGCGIADPEREYKFHSQRKWRFDFAWPDLMIAVEVHGGTAYGVSRHSRGHGFENDREKMNTAQTDGWVVLEFTTEQVTSGYAIKVIDGALKRAAALR